jgi:glutamate-ammonia-ligase adenylyltransferase
MEDPESIRNRIESFDGQPSRVLARALSRLAWRDPSQRPEALIRWQHREILGLLLSRLEPTGFWLSGESFSEALSAIAEATLISSLDLLSPPGPVAVIGLGHLGGHEMALGSDLDLMLVAGDQVDPVDLDRFAQSYMLCLSRLGLYPIDLRLRPEGRNGAIARTVSSYRAYYQRWGTTWERQALLKARVVAGDRHLRAQVSPMIEDAIFSRPFGPAEIREIRLMKARVEKERLGPREDPRFHLKFGAGALADVEWTVQLLQLKHRIGGTQTVPTLEAMARRGIVHPEDAETLTASYRLCTQLRNQCFLVSGHALSSLPSQVDLLGTLARSLDTSPSELRESFLRVTRRARRVTEKLFYGLGS